jgi:hypothetical protein
LTIAEEVYNGTKTKGYEPAFKNAKFWTNENHWEWATKPNVRESFVLVLKISYPCRKVANCIL